ncbi:hypothetical protein ACNKHW_16200 [Shigella flexneri]
MPAQVRPLYQLWRDGQALQLQLAEKRRRTVQLQAVQRQQAGSSSPATSRSTAATGTRRRLENLTDLERQLSTRKPAGNFSPDTPAASEKPAPSTHEVTPDEP